MTSESESPYMFTMNGTINGMPSTVEFDVRQTLADRANREGEVLTEEELDARSSTHLHDLLRMQEAVQTPQREPGRLERAAVKIGTAIGALTRR